MSAFDSRGSDHKIPGRYERYYGHRRDSGIFPDSLLGEHGRRVGNLFSLVIKYILAFIITAAVLLGLLAAGAIGNVIDRIRLGYVTDFLSFYNLFGYEFPAFNVADICVTAGSIGLVIYLIFLSSKKKAFREGTPLYKFLYKEKAERYKLRVAPSINLREPGGGLFMQLGF